MAETRVTIRTWKESTGTAASDPLSDQNRIGCKNGQNCLDFARRGHPARAHYYCVVEKTGAADVEATRRAFYLCTVCAVPFAHRYGVELKERL